MTPPAPSPDGTGRDSASDESRWDLEVLVGLVLDKISQCRSEWILSVLVAAMDRIERPESSGSGGHHASDQLAGFAGMGNYTPRKTPDAGVRIALTHLRTVSLFA